MKNILLLTAILSAVLFTSCRKDRIPDEPQAPQVVDDLKVPAGFDWKTTKDISLILGATKQGIVEVTNAQGVPYQKAYLSAGTTYTMKLTVPTYENAVNLRFMGQTVSLELNSTTLNYQFN